MSKNALLSVIDQLSEFQVGQLSKMAESFLAVNTELSNTAPKACPCCKSKTASFIRKGFSGRKQRYQCKECGKKFTFDTGKLTAFSHQDGEKRIVFIEDTLALKTLDACAEHIGVCHTTAFNMRQKLLGFLEDAAKQDHILDGMVEADETYIQKGRKGCLITDRKPRKHGEKAALRGISNELACICVATDREGNLIANCVNSGKPSSEEIKKAIGDRIAENVVFQCDGEKAYNKLIEEKSGIKIVLLDGVIDFLPIRCLRSECLLAI